jgi:hypothetical protein
MRLPFDERSRTYLVQGLNMLIANNVYKGVKLGHLGIALALLVPFLGGSEAKACGVPLGGLIGAIANATQDCTEEFQHTAADFCLLKGFKPGTQYYDACVRLTVTALQNDKTHNNQAAFAAAGAAMQQAGMMMQQAAPPPPAAPTFTNCNRVGNNVQCMTH